VKAMSGHQIRLRVSSLTKWKVSIFGLGYVGLSHAVAYALKGVKVIGFDVDKVKLKFIEKGIPPIKELGVVENLENLVKDRKLRVTGNHKDAILSTDITFVSVNTPSLPDGHADLSQVKSAISMIGQVLRNKNEYHLVVVNSTIPPKTTEDVVKPLLEETSSRIIGEEIGLCFMPEFLREGSAIQDILEPWRIVVGEVDKKSGDTLERFLMDVHGNKLPPIIRTTPVNAELIKYGSNAFLATRVSFINTMARVCELLPGADVDVIAYGMGLDPRIGFLYLSAGPGFGGSCLPKDLKALIKTCENFECDPLLFRAVNEVNEQQIKHVVKIVEEALGNLKDKYVAVLGLAFKANTDDIRDSQAIKIIKFLIEKGTKVKVYDPEAMKNARNVLKDLVEYSTSSYECIKNCDATIIVTDWNEFKELRAEDYKRLMKKPIIIDTRRIYRNKFKEFHEKTVYIPMGIGKKH